MNLSDESEKVFNSLIEMMEKKPDELGLDEWLVSVASIHYLFDMFPEEKKSGKIFLLRVNPRKSRELTC